ncbi:MAG: TolC family protein [Rubrivivax sp.]
MSPEQGPSTRARGGASRHHRVTRLGRLASLAAAALLVGCSTLSPDAGFGAVVRLAEPHLRQPLAWPRSEAERQQAADQVATWLQQPLTMDSAVRVALLNNPGLQAAYQQLRIAQADWVQAGRLPNPGFSLGRVRQGDERETEAGLHISLSAWLALPLRQAVAERRMAQSQADAAHTVLQLAADVQKAWVMAVAAEEGLRYARQVLQAAEAGAELARRMQSVGNFNALQRSREQAFYADAALALARAEHQRLATRERLTRMLGLWGAQTAFTLPDSLPDLPAQPREQPDIEQLALAQRLDIQATRLMLDESARQQGLTQRQRWTTGWDIGVTRSTGHDAPPARGWELGLEIPLFDNGAARAARADAVHAQALHRAAQTAIDARSQVREAYGAYRSAWDIARHQRDEVVPLQRRISDENLLRYNGMLIGVFELLADARAQIRAVQGAIAALRDFWLAQAELEMALVGRPGPGLSALSVPASGGTPPAAGAAAGEPPH